MMLAKVTLALLSAAALAGAAIGIAPRSAPVPPQQAAPAAAATDPAALLRAEIATGYGAPTLATTEYKQADLRTLIGARIDPALLTAAQAIQGADYRFAAADGSSRHAGLIILRYASPALAAARAKPLLGPRRFFRESKILTPMVAASQGDTVAIFFTESGGDARMTAVLNQAATRFAGR